MIKHFTDAGMTSSTKSLLRWVDAAEFRLYVLNDFRVGPTHSKNRYFARRINNLNLELTLSYGKNSSPDENIHKVSRQVH